MTPSPQPRYLIHISEVDRLLEKADLLDDLYPASAHEMRRILSRVQGRINSPSPAPTEPDFCKCLKIALKEEFLLSDFCRVCDGRKTCGIDGFKEQLLKHDAAIVAATLDKLDAMCKVAAREYAPDPDEGEWASDSHRDPFNEVREWIKSLRSTPSAPEQEERR